MHKCTDHSASERTLAPAMTYITLVPLNPAAGRSLWANKKQLSYIPLGFVYCLGLHNHVTGFLFYLQQESTYGPWYFLLWFVLLVSTSHHLWCAVAMLRKFLSIKSINHFNPFAIISIINGTHNYRGFPYAHQNCIFYCPVAIGNWHVTCTWL